MSVWVMTSPLTIAVALTTDGMAVPNICGLSGRLSALALFGAPVPAASCAAAAVATAIASAAARVPSARRNEIECC